MFIIFDRTLLVISTIAFFVCTFAMACYLDQGLVSLRLIDHHSKGIFSMFVGAPIAFGIAYSWVHKWMGRFNKSNYKNSSTCVIGPQPGLQSNHGDGTGSSPTQKVRT